MVGENPQTFGGRSVRNEVFCVKVKEKHRREKELLFPYLGGKECLFFSNIDRLSSGHGYVSG